MTAEPRSPQRWDGWGDPALATPLSDSITGLLHAALGVAARENPPRTAEQVVLRDSTLTDGDRDRLTAIVGAAFVSTGHTDRLAHAGGKSTPDLLRRRDTGTQDAPDAVVLPSTEREIADLLAVCAELGIAVVPFGGGTSVVGGVSPLRANFSCVVALDLRRFDTLLELDPVSGTAVLGAGLTGPRAEELLAAHGYELGHYPQSFRFATIGGFAATRSSGQDSAGYGRFDDMVQGMRVVTPIGTLDLGRAPASAAGPDLRELFLGSEGAFGVITTVRVRVHPVPETRLFEAWSFPDFATGSAALRAVVQQGTGPTVIRLSDEAETGVNLAMTHKIGEAQVTGGCLAVTVFEGSTTQATARHDMTRATLQTAGATSLGDQPARSWDHGRFDAPYMRDALLDAGALCETLETATSWSNLDRLKAAVTEALQRALRESGTESLVLCHISHVYPTGASLYFTVIAAQCGDARAQWATAKSAAADAIIANGGTITHHHAVGTDHRPWLAAELGAPGATILRAVKAAVDPAGILNPGKLIP